MIKQKKAAMEMSVGTIVTVVLLMAVLILGIFLVQRIFKSSTNSIDQIDKKVNTEINKLFSDDGEKKIVIYPEEPALKKGDSGGVGISIRNTGRTEETFSYTTKYKEDDCDLGETKALSLISLGLEETGIRLGSGGAMDSAILIKFNIAEDTPLCLIRYRVEVEKADGSIYTFKDVDLEIVS